LLLKAPKNHPPFRPRNGVEGVTKLRMGREVDGVEKIGEVSSSHFCFPLVE